MTFEIEFTDIALDDIRKLRNAGEKAALKKIDALLNELQEHPYTGTGKPKPLKGSRAGTMVTANYRQTPIGLFRGR
jgi:toxin YoeB